MLRPTAVTGVVLAAALLTAGCSGSAADEPSATASSSTSSSASSDPSTGPSASPSGTVVDTFEILPDSVLAVLPDFAYVTAEARTTR